MYTNIYLIFKQNINMSISEHLTHEKKGKRKIYIYTHKDGSQFLPVGIQFTFSKIIYFK